MFQATIEYNLSVQGLAFIITGDAGLQGEGGGFLGWLNSTSNGNESGTNVLCSRSR